MPNYDPTISNFKLSKISVCLAMAFLGNAPIVNAQSVNATTVEAAKKQTPQTNTTSDELPTVVVSANKRIEALQNVPQSISVLNEENLQRNNIRQVDDIIAFTPTLTKTESDSPQNSSINLRGIGTQSIGIGIESDVAVIVDDVPYALGFQAFRDLADVQRIEVLAGPQSTMFGKSAIAGAINIVTKPISGPIKTTGSVYLTSDQEHKISAAVGGSVTDKFGFRIAVSKGSWAGNLHNLTTDRMVNGNLNKSVNVKLNWNPIENLDVDFSARYNVANTTCCTLAITSFGTANLPTSTLGGTNNKVLISQAFAGITPNIYNTDVRMDAFNGTVSNNKGFSLKETYTFPSGATLVSITSADNFHGVTSTDQDLTDVPVYAYTSYVNSAGKTITTGTGLQQGATGQAINDIQSKTQEFRFVSASTGNFRYLAGLWWGHNIIRRDNRSNIFGLPSFAANQLTQGTYNINRAIFGQADWEFVPTYTLTAGLRVQKQTSGFDFHGTGNNPNNTVFTNRNFIPFGGQFVAYNNFTGDNNDERATTGKISLQKQFTPALMAYGSFSTGYKGKAYDMGSGMTAAIAAANPVAAETAKNYELGLKANFLNNRLTVATSIFAADYRNYQQSMAVVLIDPVSLVQTSTTALNSVPLVTTRGAELYVNALLYKNLLLNFGYAYTESIVADFKTMSCYTNQTVAQGCVPNAALRASVQDISGQPMPFASRNKITAGFKYDLRMENQSFDLFVAGNGNYQSKQQGKLNQEPTAFIGSRTRFNASVGLKDKKGMYTLSAGVNNTADAHTSVRATTLPISGVAGSTSWSPRRDDFRYTWVKLDVRY